MPPHPHPPSLSTNPLDVAFFGKQTTEKQRTITMVDNYGDTWNITATNAWGEQCARREVVLTGDSDAFPSATVSGYACKDERTVYLETINEAPDGCRSFSDAFVYEGINTGHLTFAGEWTSYCGDVPIASGAWDGVFDAPKSERSTSHPVSAPAMGREALRLPRQLPSNSQ